MHCLAYLQNQLVSVIRYGVQASFLFTSISAVCTKGIITVARIFLITCRFKSSECACSFIASHISLFTRGTFIMLQFSGLSYFFSNSTILSLLDLIKTFTVNAFTAFPSAYLIIALTCGIPQSLLLSMLSIVV